MALGSKLLCSLSFLMHFLWVAFVHFPVILAALVNVTVDNKFGDPRTGAQFSYSPNGAWFDEPGCATCSAHPNPAYAYDRTWIEGTFTQPGSGAFPGVVLNASINFTGTAIYVFCIVANSNTDPDGYSNLTAFVDDAQVGTYINSPTGAQTYEYNVPVIVNESLPEGAHTFTLQNGNIGGMESLVLFDYLTYTLNDETSSSVHSPATRGKVVGAIFGAISGLLLIALAIVLLNRRQRKQFRLPFPVRLSFKFPEARWFPRRSAHVVSPPPPSFNPTLLVQRTMPTHSNIQTFAPHSYVPPTNENRISSSAAWADARLEPQRRQESEGSLSGTGRNVERQKKGNSRGVKVSRQAQFVESVDVSSHYDLYQPPAPPLPPLRRFTVRNK